MATSLLGAGILVQSGVFERDGELVRGPELDTRQTGYGPGYRIYQGGDGHWFALVLPGHEAWLRLASLPEVTSLPATYTPLRGGAADAVARQAEAVLEAAFATAPAAEWAGRLRGLGLLAELIESLDRDGFRRAVLDDPVNRQLGRVVAYETADWGHFEQIGPLLRCGPVEPVARGGPRLMLPGIGEHTVEVSPNWASAASRSTPSSPRRSLGNQALEAGAAGRFPARLSTWGSTSPSPAPARSGCAT